MNSNRRLKLFAIAIGFALLFHFSVLYHLHELPLQWVISHGRSMDEQRVTQAFHREQPEREQQLARLFKSVQRSTSTSPFALESVSALTDNLIATTDSHLTHIGNTSSPPAGTLLVVPSAEQATERSAAAERMLGELELELESQAAIHSLDVGSPSENSSSETISDGGSTALKKLASANVTLSATEPMTDATLAGSSLTNGIGHDSSGGQGTGAATIASSDDFILSVDYARAGHTYLFRLTLSPKPAVVFKYITHNIYFLIDRSSSIGRTRYEATKKAIKRSFSTLKPGDRFNILVFDERVNAMASQPVTVNEENFQRAGEFLDAQPHGGLFAATDLYGSLGDIVPKVVLPKEVHSAILFSDGDTQLKPEQQRRAIGQWTSHNIGKVSLFSLAIGKDNNLPLLDLISTCNKGCLVYAGEESLSATKLAELLKSIRTPIGKEMVATAVSSGPSKITLYPSTRRLPHLYLDTPYELYGTIDKLEDFILFIQGRYYDRWLDIKHKVSFHTARQVPAADLERPLAKQYAYNLYELYLHDGNKQHLESIKRLLSPYGLTPAFH